MLHSTRGSNIGSKEPTGMDTHAHSHGERTLLGLDIGELGHSTLHAQARAYSLNNIVVPSVAWEGGQQRIAREFQQHAARFTDNLQRSEEHTSELQSPTNL